MSVLVVRHLATPLPILFHTLTFCYHDLWHFAGHESRLTTDGSPYPYIPIYRGNCIHKRYMFFPAHALALHSLFWVARASTGLPARTLALGCVLCLFAGFARRCSRVAIAVIIAYRLGLGLDKYRTGINTTLDFLLSLSLSLCKKLRLDHGVPITHRAYTSKRPIFEIGRCFRDR
jgi:hypothetical protein